MGASRRSRIRLHSPGGSFAIRCAALFDAVQPARVLHRYGVDLGLLYPQDLKPGNDILVEVGIPPAPILFIANLEGRL